MKKYILILLVIPAGLFSFRAKEKIEPTKVYLEGNSIVYDGLITKEANDTLSKLYSKDIKRLILNSNGGEINVGIDLGEWVFDHNLDVEIRDHAFSSAADYVFTAGQKKILHKNSTLGWHGGASSDYGWLLSKLMNNYLKNVRAREALFFKKVLIKQEIVSYGQRPEFNKYNDGNYIGWTYSINALTKLGVKNIILLDGTWEPLNSSPKTGKKIFTIENIDIQ